MELDVQGLRTDDVQTAARGMGARRALRCLAGLAQPAQPPPPRLFFSTA